jgi:ubiquinone/menaquinone biosynthesis C-methylase UbiE
LISDGGWLRYSIWEHSRSVRELYTSRARMEAEEMTCAAQAAELLAPRVEAGESLLDVGCGSGYFFHSLRTRKIPVEYHGIDASPTLIAIGRRELEPYGLPADRLQELRIEDLDGKADHVVCMNVISNLDNYHRPLERLLSVAAKTVILRESAKDAAEYRYVRDAYLDEGVELNVHVNAYPTAELIAFMESYGFAVSVVEDRYTGGKAQDVIGFRHWWTFFVAERVA